MFLIGKTMSTGFPTNYTEILNRMDQFDPVYYGKTRNFTQGGVSYLSPYISRGVISTRQVLEAVLSKGYSLDEIESFAKELCWRDYFQRVAQNKNINEFIRQEQADVSNDGIPLALVEANSGITALDEAIQQLYQTGYMHNHCRMYLASVVCNIARSHWLHPAKWLYYHLLDGDWASNACSWQWVAGSNSTKKYYANQENINKYTRTNQTGSFLDASYEEIAQMQTPQHLTDIRKLDLKTELPPACNVVIDPLQPTFLYNYYNLDPLRHAQEKGNRILLLEPEFFAAYPVSSACINFTLSLAQNIDGLQIYVGSFESLYPEIQSNEIYFKEHPLNKGYRGIEEPRDWIVGELTGYDPSFFKYWKKVEKNLKKPE